MCFRIAVTNNFDLAKHIQKMSSKFDLLPEISVKCADLALFLATTKKKIKHRTKAYDNHNKWSCLALIRIIPTIIIIILITNH